MKVEIWIDLYDSGLVLAHVHSESAPPALLPKECRRFRTYVDLPDPPNFPTENINSEMSEEITSKFNDPA